MCSPLLLHFTSIASDACLTLQNTCTLRKKTAQIQMHPVKKNRNLVGTNERLYWRFYWMENICLVWCEQSWRILLCWLQYILLSSQSVLSWSSCTIELQNRRQWFYVWLLDLNRSRELLLFLLLNCRHSALSVGHESWPQRHLVAQQDSTWGSQRSSIAVVKRCRSVTITTKPYF